MRFLLLLLIILVRATLHSQGFVIDSFNVSLLINKDGVVHVKENILVNFTESKHGIYRSIPIAFKKNDTKYKTEISNISVDHPFKLSKSTTSVTMKIGDQNITKKGLVLYQINYDILGPFISSDDYQELYWNVIGNDWEVPIHNTSVSIVFPDSNAILDTKLFTGVYGDVAKAGFLKKIGNNIQGYSTKSLSPGEGFSVAVKLPQGYIASQYTMKIVTNKSNIDRSIPINKQLPWAAAGLAGLLGLLGFWFTKRGSVDNAHIEPQAYPPLDLTPAEVGAFYDHIVHDRDVISLIPYWGEQGHIKMEYDKQQDETYIVKLKELKEGRPDYEYMLFNAIFKNDDSTTLSKIKHSLYNDFQKVKSTIKKEIVDLEMYDGDYRSWFKSYPIFLFLAALIPLFVLAFVRGYWLVGVCLVVLLMAVIVVASLPGRLSAKGDRVKRELLGFHKFLKQDDAQHYGDLLQKDPRYFEKVFPYVVAFNLDKRFLSKIKPYQSFAPLWYYYAGSNTTNQVDLSTFGDQFSPKEIGSAFGSMPTSSGSGGGFSGGGFSGGGFGGGGGGSW